MIVEAVSGERLDVFLDEHVFQPLGMTDTFFRPGDSLRTRVAPTELTPPRGYPLQGEVHDENAYALGGIAGHAGLFSTAADLSVFAQMMLNGGVYNGVHIVSDTTVELFTRRTAGHRALGWDMCDDGDDGSCGRFLSERAYGHTGFTGTSLWIDPDRQNVRRAAHQPRARGPCAPAREGDRRRPCGSRRRGGRRRDRRSGQCPRDAGPLPCRPRAGVEPSAAARTPVAPQPRRAPGTPGARRHEEAEARQLAARALWRSAGCA